MNLTPFITRLKILDKNRNVIPFRLNWAQQQYIETVEKMHDQGRPIRIDILKARQMGLSTATEAIMFALAFMYPNSHGVVISHDQDSYEHLLGMTKRYWETFFAKSLYHTDYKSRRELAWTETGSSITTATAKTLGAGRSQTIHALHASEIAFWPDPETLLTGLRQTIPNLPSTFICLESTANGVGNYFHTQWEAATSGDSEYIPLFFPWWKHPEYTAESARLPMHLITRTSDERVLHTYLRSQGLTPAECDSRLVWRRYALRDLCQNDLTKLQQEYPACVTGDTRVGTSNGIMPIRLIAPGEWTSRGMVTQSHAQPDSRVFRLTTHLGYVLRGTFDHPVFAESGLLLPLVTTKGHRIQLARPQFASSPHTFRWVHLGITHSVEITEDWGLFLGLFMGDGSMSGDGTLSIVCDSKDTDLIDRIVKLIHDIFGVDAATRAVGTKKGGTEIRVSRKDFVPLFDALGLIRRNGSSAIKRHVHVPDLIWQSPKPVVSAFLSGLFEADGFNGYKVPRIVLFSRYRQFLSDVQLLLLGFGITAKLRTANKITGDGHTYVGNELQFRVLQAIAFNEHIGFLSERKKFITKGSTRGRNAIPMEMVDEVVSVEPDGIETTYDLTVHTGEAFDANGILTHNTPEEAFVSTGRNVFPADHLNLCYSPAEGQRGYVVVRDGQPLFQSSSDGPAIIWKHPSRDRDHGRYIVAGDPTHTTRGDYAAIQVLNRRTLEQVCRVRIKIDPINFAKELYAVARYYNDALLTTETTGPGYSTIGALVAMGYPYLHHTTWADKTPGNISESYGFATNVQRKNWAVGALLNAFVEHAITLHDATTYSECKNYVSLDNGGYGPADSRHGYDDCVMSLAIALLAHLQEPPLPPRGADKLTAPWGEWSNAGSIQESFNSLVGI